MDADVKYKDEEVGERCVKVGRGVNKFKRALKRRQGGASES